MIGSFVIAHEAEDPGPRHLRSPARKLLPRTDKLILVAGSNDPCPARVGARHAGTLAEDGSALS